MNQTAPPLQPHLANEAFKLALHESGHWVASRQLGFASGDLTARLLSHRFPPGREGAASINLVEDLHSIDGTVAYLERRIQVCWAGVLAETLDRHRTGVDTDEACRLLNGDAGRSDARVAQELNQLLRNLKGSSHACDPLSQLKELSDGLWLRTIRIVEDQRELILGLADNLTQRIRKAGVGQIARFLSSEIEGLPAVREWVRSMNLGPVPPEDPLNHLPCRPASVT